MYVLQWQARMYRGKMFVMMFWNVNVVANFIHTNYLVLYLIYCIIIFSLRGITSVMISLRPVFCTLARMTFCAFPCKISSLRKRAAIPIRPRIPTISVFLQDTSLFHSEIICQTFSYTGWHSLQMSSSAKIFLRPEWSIISFLLYITFLPFFYNVYVLNYWISKHMFHTN